VLGIRQPIRSIRLQKLGVGEVVEPRCPGAAGRGPLFLLSDVERRTEALLGAAVAIEHARIVGAVDARVTAAYANAVLDNCRAQAADDSHRYLPLVGKHLLWLRSLPAGSSLTMTYRR
jgi:hypothetical protein